MYRYVCRMKRQVEVQDGGVLDDINPPECGGSVSQVVLGHCVFLVHEDHINVKHFGDLHHLVPLDETRFFAVGKGVVEVVRVCVFFRIR